MKVTALFWIVALMFLACREDGSQLSQASAQETSLQEAAPTNMVYTGKRMNLCEQDTGLPKAVKNAIITPFLT